MTPKPLYKFDLVNNSNNSIWDDVEDEEPDGAQTYTLRGLVVRINKTGIVLFVPFLSVLRVFCPRKYLGYSPHLGEWFTVHTNRRRPREKDEEKPPLFSHIAVGAIIPLDIYKFFPEWKQRIHGGIFEFLLRAKVSRYENSKGVENTIWYLVNTTTNIEVLVPRHRFDSILNSNDPALRTFEFWATLSVYVPEAGGVSLHLLDSTGINEILPNGDVLSLGSGLTEVDAEIAQTFSIAKENIPPGNHYTETPTMSDFLKAAAIFQNPTLRSIIYSQGLKSDYNTVVEGIRQWKT